VRVRWGLLVIPFLGHSDATEHSEPNRIPVFTLGASRPEYADSFPHEATQGFGRRILRYELVDTRTGKSEVLLDSPAT
jgi:hypothetical protein